MLFRSSLCEGVTILAPNKGSTYLAPFQAGESKKFNEPGGVEPQALFLPFQWHQALQAQK